jgi:hypothetical protein
VDQIVEADVVDSRVFCKQLGHMRKVFSFPRIDDVRDKTDEKNLGRHVAARVDCLEGKRNRAWRRRKWSRVGASCFRLFERQKAIVEEITCLQDMALAMGNRDSAMRCVRGVPDSRRWAKRSGRAWWVLSVVMEL